MKITVRVGKKNIVKNDANTGGVVTGSLEAEVSGLPSVLEPVGLPLRGLHSF